MTNAREATGSTTPLEGDADDDASPQLPKAEIRLAVSMNGGVSLAIWIGGVTTELYELARTNRAPHASRYADLRNLLEADVTIDVISGSSAGGINGALLGVALANDAPPIDSIRSLWLDTGDIDVLLQPASTKAPTSLLRGDHFQATIARGLEEVARSGKDHDADRHVECWLTGSRLEARTTRYVDAIGGEIVDASYEALFQFRHTPQSPTDTEDGTPAATEDGSPTDGPARHFSCANIEALATAARASAAFPVAFEPVWVPRKTMKEFLKSTGSGPVGDVWMIDGGTLNNKPLKPALDAIFLRPATGRVIRNLAYVVPDPGAPERSVEGRASDDTPVATPDAPGMWEVLQKALLTLPRQQTIAAELRQIQEHNDQIERLHETQLQLAADIGGELVDVARPMAGLYRDLQARLSARRTATNLVRYWSERGQWDAISADFSARTIENAFEEKRRKRFPDPFLPDSDPSTHGETAADGEAFWGYGVTAAKRIASMCIGLVQAALAHTPTHPDGGLRDAVRSLTDAQQVLHDQLHTVVATGGNPTGWFDEYASEAKENIARSGLDQWAADYYAQWNQGESAAKQAAGKQERFSTIGAASLRCAEELVGRVAPALRTLAEWAVLHPESAPPVARERLSFLRAAADGLTVAPTDGDGKPRDGLTAAQWALRQLLALEVVYFSTNQEVETDQRLDLVQFSAYATDHLSRATRRRTPDDKLTGVALGHFAAFYKRSWRANDWMWGRLDGASRLVDLTVRPERLQQVWYGRRDEFIDALRTAATNARGQEPWVSDELRRYLSAEFEAALQTDRLQAEIATITGTGSSSSRSPLRGDLPEVRRLVARRHQLEIVCHELIGVAKAVLADRDAGSQVDPNAAKFVRSTAHAFGVPLLLGIEDDDESDATDKCKKLRPTALSVEAMLYAFDDCKIGEETIANDVGSDRLTILAGRTAAVSTAALQALEPPAIVRPVLAVVRGLGRLTHLLSGLAGGLGGRSHTSQLILAASFAAGGAALAVAVIGGDPGLAVSTIGLVLLVAPLIVAGHVQSARGTAISFAVVLALALLAWNIDSLLDLLDVAPTGDAERDGWSGQLVDFREAICVVIAIVGFLFIGRDVLSPPRGEPELPPSPPEDDPCPADDEDGPSAHTDERSSATDTAAT